MISPALSDSSPVCTALLKARAYDSVENVVGENVVIVVIVVASGGIESFQTNDPTNISISSVKLESWIQLKNFTSIEMFSSIEVISIQLFKWVHLWLSVRKRSKERFIINVFQKTWAKGLWGWF